jgi:hypothetical protein
MAISFNIKRKIDRLLSRGNVLRDGRRCALFVFALVLKCNKHIFRAAVGVATAFVIGVGIVVVFVAEFEEVNGL